MMAVGHVQGLASQGLTEAVDGCHILDAPEGMALAFGVGHIQQGVALSGLLQPAGDVAPAIAVEGEDRADIAAGSAQEAQAVLLGRPQGALVRADNAGLPGHQAQADEKAPPRVTAPPMGEVLMVEVESWRLVTTKAALSQPLPQSDGRPEVTIQRLVIPGLPQAELQADDVMWASAMKLLLLSSGNDIVRRADDRVEVKERVEPQGTKGADVGQKLSLHLDDTASPLVGREAGPLE
jgi:hypothetical protein